MDERCRCALMHLTGSRSLQAPGFQKTLLQTISIQCALAPCRTLALRALPLKRLKRCVNETEWEGGRERARVRVKKEVARERVRDKSDISKECKDEGRER